MFLRRNVPRRKFRGEMSRCRLGLDCGPELATHNLDQSQRNLLSYYFSLSLFWITFFICLLDWKNLVPGDAPQSCQSNSRTWYHNTIIRTSSFFIRFYQHMSSSTEDFVRNEPQKILRYGYISGAPKGVNSLLPREKKLSSKPILVHGIARTVQESSS